MMTVEAPNKLHRRLCQELAPTLTSRLSAGNSADRGGFQADRGGLRPDRGELAADRGEFEAGSRGASHRSREAERRQAGSGGQHP